MTQAPRHFPEMNQCTACAVKKDRVFCNMSDEAIAAMEAMTFSSVYPKGATLFHEEQPARGVFILCSGKAKLFTSSTDGKTLVIRIAEPGEVLGMGATITGKTYEVSVETAEPCQVNFIRRDDFLRFLDEHGEACLRAAQDMSDKYHAAHREIRTLGLSQTAAEKLARLFLNWCPSAPATNGGEVRIPMLMTHEELGQMIGISRETVTRLLGDLKRKEIIQIKGSTLIIRDRAALESMVTT
jgi:CRP/FNR family transcriptional regulator, cyclic AMP receptor protein